MNNFHTHTWRCKHAFGTVSDYVEAAKKAGLQILGMSDHTPLPDGRWSHVRMDISDLDGYEKEFKEADTEGLVLLKGLECEWESAFDSFYREEILGERAFDYLIGASHYFRKNGQWEYLSEMTTAGDLKGYADNLIAAMSSGLFSFIAHPDGFAAGYKRWDENARDCSADILAAAEELQIPLEINGYGFRKAKINTPDGLRNVYPLEKFWELAGEYNIKAICNSDAHDPVDIAASIPEGRELASKYGIPVTEEIRTGILNR